MKIPICNQMHLMCLWKCLWIEVIKRCFVLPGLCYIPIPHMPTCLSNTHSLNISEYANSFSSSFSCKNFVTASFFLVVYGNKMVVQLVLCFTSLISIRKTQTYVRCKFYNWIWKDARSSFISTKFHLMNSYFPCFEVKCV